MNFEIQSSIFNIPGQSCKQQLCIFSLTLYYIYLQALKANYEFWNDFNSWR